MKAFLILCSNCVTINIYCCINPVEVKVIQASITKHRAFLRSMLECQYGLLDELESRCVLTDEQVDLIKSKVPRYEKNDILLNEISKETEVFKLNEFLLALEVTHQSHLATYIVNNGGKYFTISSDLFST